MDTNLAFCGKSEPDVAVKKKKLSLELNTLKWTHFAKKSILHRSFNKNIAKKKKRISAF